MPLRSSAPMSHDQLGKIVEGSASEIYIFCPRQFTFLLVNRGARENLGYTFDELAELTPWDIKPLVDETGFRDLVAPLLTGQVPDLMFETVHRRKDGTDYDVSVHLQLLRTGADDVFFAAIRDITDEKRLNAELELKAVQLEEAVASKEVLLHEVNHRVKNSLQVVMSLLQLHARQASDPTLKAALAEAGNRVSVVAAIHQKLYTTSQHALVDFSELLGELAQQIIGTMAVESRIEIENRLEPGIELGIDVAVPLSLVVAEILTNSVKYAFPDGQAGTIHLNLQHKDDKLHLRVGDDGVGLPASFEASETRGLGTRIIKALSLQVRAALNVESSPSGTVFIIDMPHHNRAEPQRAGQ